MRHKCNAFILFAFVLAFIATCSGECFTETYGGKFARCQSLNSYFDIYWNVEGNDLTILMHLRGTANAWMGLGTSVNGGMRGADIAVARKVKGNYVLEDRFVPGLEGEPNIDEHQDLTLISATSDNTSTTVIFTRKLIPCDINEDVPILEHGTPIIFAYGTTFGYHSKNRGSTVVYFHYVPPVKHLPNGTEAVQISFPPYHVPAKDTTYVCSPIEFPHDQKYHIVRWRPIITPGSEAYVHHMVLFTCPKKQTQTAPWECGMSPQDCSGFLIAWSVGQTGNDWVDDYALPMGGDDGSKYGVLQMHYNNPTEVSNIVDSSGIELFFTSELRKYDMGMLVMSTSMRTIFIPPHDVFEQSSECPRECTSTIPPLNLIGYFPHMHEIGQKIWTQHIRNGTELAEIHRDDHYDFGRQQVYPLDLVILPGDSVKLHCVWDSMSRDTNTTGGESSSQEMCVLIMQYYPVFNGKSLFSCSDGGSQTKASCVGKSVTMIPQNYTALPALRSTCTGNAENSATQTVPFVTLVLFVAALLM